MDTLDQLLVSKFLIFRVILHDEMPFGTSTECVDTAVSVFTEFAAGIERGKCFEQIHISYLNQMKRSKSTVLLLSLSIKVMLCQITRISFGK